MALAAMEQGSPSGAHRGNPDRVLVVDDEPPIVAVATEILELAGYEAVGVNGPDEAARLPMDYFDVVVTDYRMPRIDGLTLFGQLRERNPQLVGVLVTGFGTLSLVQTAMRSGFNAILLKPFPLERLTAAVERALRQRRLGDENARLQALLEAAEAAQDLNRPRDRVELGEAIARLARRITDAAGAETLLADGVDGALRPLPGDPASRLSWSEGFVGLSVKHVRDAAWKQDETARLALPLTYSRVCEGVLLLERDRPFEGLEIERLSLLVRQGALALAHLRLFADRLRDQKLALVGQLAGAICERVRTPIARIGEAARGLLVDEPDYRDMIIENVDRLETMCGELSDFVGGADDLHREPVALGELLTEVARHHEAQVTARGIELVVTIEREITLDLDARKIRRAVQNLLQNAAEATSGPGRIEVRLELTEAEAVVVVADTGRGMSAEARARVFEPFYTCGKKGGTGLGGVVVRSAVTAHGGRIELTSREGEGTCFRLCFPRPVQTRPAPRTALPAPRYL